MKHPRLIQVKASAGSGKTFALTRRFLALLSGAGGEDTAPACRGAAPAAYAWPEILAVTFTNKAAAEMKSRLVGALKARALGHDVPEMADAPWEPERAEAMLERILARYARLNVRTIDSLLNLLLTCFALEAGLPPDFELGFDDSELMDEALDAFLAQCEAGDAGALRAFEDTLRTVVEAERKGGFWIMDAVRKRLAELAEVLARDMDVCTDQREIAALLNAPCEAMRRTGRELRAALDGLDVMSLFLKFLDKIEAAGPFEPAPDSAFIAKPGLADCVKKKDKDRVPDRAEALYAKLKHDHAAFAAAHAVLFQAFVLAPAVDLARRLRRHLAEAGARRGVLPSAELPGRVLAALDGENGVPDAYCRLGGRLHHMLVDEFQDTSRDQWAAMTPLAEECLSKGGSLFYVGDVKQAIYGWRGGDATLFDAVAGQSGLAELAEAARRPLESNWRSRAAVREFNNGFFERLADPAVADALAGELLAGAGIGELAHWRAALAAAFADARQAPPPKQKDGGEDGGKNGRKDGGNDGIGYVRLTRLPGGRVADLEADTLDALERLVTQELAPRRPYGDLAVLVRSGRHADLVCERLLGAGVPVITENSLQLARHPVVRQLTALLAWLDAPEDDLALTEVLLGQEVFLGATGLDRAAVLDWLAARPERRRWRRLREDFPEIWTRFLAPLMGNADCTAPYDLLRRAAALFTVMERNPDAELYLRRFYEVVHQAGERGLGSLTAFLDFWRRRGHEEKVPLPENVDAVRILTIHKAKGLEFPVAIVPFHHWALTAGPDYGAAEYAGRRFLVRLGPAQGEPWRAHCMALAQEQLNLLYVAWTRAREELYGFFPARLERAPQSAVLAALARPELLPGLPDADEDAGPDDEDGAAAPAVFERGVRPGAADVPPRTVEALPDPLPGRVELPRLRVYRHLEEAHAEERMRGEAAHRAMERLTPSGDDHADSARAVRLALRDFPLLAAKGPAAAAELEGLCRYALSVPEVRAALAAGRSEMPLMDEHGEARRPDLLHLAGGRGLVVEFKTGGASPEHPRQVRGYLRALAGALAGAGESAALQGLLVYLDQRRVEKVEAK
ncbi:MAG: UvrD-helicase domain-containing protein [Desulfovibrionaceae bacterium]